MKRAPSPKRIAISIFLADSSSMGCQLLADALRRCRLPLSVIGTAVRSADAVKSIKAENPAIALISSQLQDGASKGFKVLSDIRAPSAKTRAILLLDSYEPQQIVDAFRGGAKGVFCRDQPFKVLCKCIGSVHRGQIWASSRELELILRELEKSAPLRVSDREPNPAGFSLSVREVQVVRMVAEGFTNREIARELTLSEHTVKNYMFRIFDKLGLSSRSELIVYFLKRMQGELTNGPDSAKGR